MERWSAGGNGGRAPRLQVPKVSAHATFVSRSKPLQELGGNAKPAGLRNRTRLEAREGDQHARQGFHIAGHRRRTLKTHG